MNATGGAVISLSLPFPRPPPSGSSTRSRSSAGCTTRRERRAPLRQVLTGVPATIGTGVRLAGRPGTLRRPTAFSACMGVTLASVELLSPVSFAQLLGGEHAAAGPYSVS